MDNQQVLIIDPVGIKGGMDYYNDQLAISLGGKNISVSVLSNYSSKSSKKIFPAGFPGNLFYQIELGNAFVKLSRFIKKKSIKTIIVHSFRTHKVDLWFAKKVVSNNIRLVVIKHDVESLLDKNSTPQDAELLNLANEIVVHNQFSFDHLIQAGIPSCKIKIIHHGDALSVPSKLSKKEARRLLNFNDHDKYILFFGMIKPTKGLNILLEAVQNCEFKIIVAGRLRKQSLSDYSVGFKKISKENRLRADINYISNEKRDLYFKSADVVVLPYRKIYQSGVLIMAVSYGIPVIASDLEPNQNFNSENNCIELFKDGDSNDLIDKINKVLNSHERKNEMVSAGFQKLEKDHRWESIAEKFLELI